MLQGITKNGDLKNVVVNDDGTLAVKVQGNEGGEGGIEVLQTSDKEVTLYASVLTLPAEELSIPVNNKVTNIMIANYSESAELSMNVNDKIFRIGANLALEIPINKNVENLILLSSENDTKIQLVVKGVE